MDFYDLLGVRRGARATEIRRAYQRLARRLHPAVNPGDPAAGGQYREATIAFEVLSDPRRRAAYDRGELPGVVAATVVTGGFEGFDFSASIAVEKVGMREIVEDVLRPAGDPEGPTPGEHLTQSTRLSFEEAFRGTRRRVHLVRQDHCPQCAGSGEVALAPSRCGDCAGQGQMRAGRGHMIFARRCPTCGGGGVLTRATCDRCGGEGRLASSEWIDIKIPPGVASGSEVRLGGAGNVGRRRGSSGDFILAIEVLPDERFVRKGDDLVTTAIAGFVEAAMGGHVTVRTPDGPVQIELPAGTQNAQRFRMRKRGMPRVDGAGRGDLWVEVRVEVPTVTDNRAKELLLALGERLASIGASSARGVEGPLVRLAGAGVREG